MKKTSKQFTLNLRDVLRAFLMAAIGAGLDVLYESLLAGSLHFDWKAIGNAALIGGVGYLLKNFFEPQKVVATPKEIENTPPALSNNDTLSQN